MIRNEIKSLYSLIILFSLCISTSKASTAERPVEIDLTKARGGDVIVLSTPDTDIDHTRTRILLPEFEMFCHVAADSDFIRWIGASNRMFPWVGANDLTSIFKERTPRPPVIPAPNRRAFQMLFKLKNGKFLVIVPLSGDTSISWLETSQDGELILDYGSLGTKPVPEDSKVPLLSWCVSDSLYEAMAINWKQIVDGDISEGNLALRYQKTYPEQLKYLGWCTWEQYHKEINEKILLDAFDQIENSGVPVRWILIDDGHQTARDMRMVSMEPSKEKFPRGWTPIMARKKADRVTWVGIWHTLMMHWKNVDENHQMQFLSPYLMPKPKGGEQQSFGGLPGVSMIPKDNPVDSQEFYMAFMRAVKKQGFDFLKTDNVSKSTTEYYGTDNAVMPQANNVRSLEHATRKLGLGLMNCSAQNTICLLNATYSASMRTSPDYRKGQLATSKSQILQSVFNVCWLGQTLWPDHDMFHSSDKQVALTMAVTKALGGGPIYLSDVPKSFNKAIVMPLCYRDGSLIRPAAPGVPVPESLFSDPLYEPSAYKVIAPLNNQSCAITVYNLNLTKDASVSGTISPSDYSHGSAMVQPYRGPWKVPSQGMVLYDWDTRKCVKLEAGGHNFKISKFGHKLFILSPVNQGWAMIGRPDKYLSPATVEIVKTKKTSITFKMHEPASIILYSDGGTPRSDLMSFKALGNGFYEAAFTGDVKSGVHVQITRGKGE